MDDDDKEEDSTARAQRHRRTRLLATVLGAWIRAHDQARVRDGELDQFVDDFSRFRSYLRGVQSLQLWQRREAYLRFCFCLASVFRRMYATSRLLRRCREASYPRELQERAKRIALNHFRSTWRNRRLANALSILRSRARRRKTALQRLLQFSPLRQLASQCLARWKERSGWEHLSKERQRWSLGLHNRVFLLRRFLRRLPRPKLEKQAPSFRQRLALQKFAAQLDRRRIARLDIGLELRMRYAQRRVIDRLLDVVAMRCFQRQRFARLLQQRDRKAVILALLCWLRRFKQLAVTRSLYVRANCFFCTAGRYLRKSRSWRRMRSRLLQVRQKRHRRLSLRILYLIRALRSLRQAAQRHSTHHSVRAVAHVTYRSMACALRAFMHRRQQHTRLLRAQILALHYFKLFRLAKGWKSLVSFVVTRIERRRKGLTAQAMYHQHLRDATVRACTAWALERHYRGFREQYLSRKVVRKWRQRLPRRAPPPSAPMELPVRLLDWVHVRRSLPAPRSLPDSPINYQSISPDLARTPPRVASLDVDFSSVDSLVQSQPSEAADSSQRDSAGPETEVEEKAKRRQRVELALQMIAAAQYWQQLLDQGHVS